MARALIDHWLVEEIVRTLIEKPGACIVLSPNAEHAKSPRIRRDGKRVHLVRHLQERLTGECLDPAIALVPGGCKTRRCLNPAHRIPSRRRTLPKERT